MIGLAVKYIILNDLLAGPINLAAPNPTTNSTLMNELRSHYAPFNFGFPTPSWAVKLGSFLIGTAPDLVLKSRKLVSKFCQMLVINLLMIVLVLQ